MVHFGAMMSGLANRRLFTSAQAYVRESLDLPGNLQGYARLCNLVTQGRLNNFAEVADAVVRFWAGIESWANGRQIRVHQTLSELLR
ncbi:MAG: hypothetical protein J0L75_08820 [Spirochaetes bacterium]|nr:hypothetical protein [Spirochaetota bacterium]